MGGRPAQRAQAALQAVPRVRYLPPEVRAHAQLDQPLPIGWGSTNSQPWTVAYMLRLLDPRPGMSVLDVGAGSGWTTDLVAWLVGPTGRVIGTEVIADLARRSRATLQASHAQIQVASKRELGAPRQAPFDRILVSADPGELPAELVAQLAPGGRMVIPVAGRMLIVSMPRTGHPSVHHAPGEFRFVRLVLAHD